MRTGFKLSKIFEYVWLMGNEKQSQWCLLSSVGRYVSRTFVHGLGNGGKVSPQTENPGKKSGRVTLLASSPYLPLASAGPWWLLGVAEPCAGRWSR